MQPRLKIEEQFIFGKSDRLKALRLTGNLSVNWITELDKICTSSHLLCYLALR